MPYAIYFEHDGAVEPSVRQTLFIPGLSEGGKASSPYLADRTLTLSNPSRVWSFSVGSSYTPTSDVVPLDTRDKLLGREIEQLYDFSSVLMTILKGDAWELQGSFVVPLTDLDVASFLTTPPHKMRLPIAVQTRITSERDKRGFRALPGRR